MLKLNVFICIILFLSLANANFKQADLLQNPFIQSAQELAQQEAIQLKTIHAWKINIQLIQQLYSSSDKTLNSILTPSDYYKLSSDRKSQLLKNYPKLIVLTNLIDEKSLLAIEKKIKSLKLKNEKFQSESKTETVRSALFEFHNGTLDLKYNALDYILGIKYSETENNVAIEKYPILSDSFGGQKENTQTDYSVIREFFKGLKVSDSDIFYDVGSGHGRVIFYGAILYPNTKFKGIELVKERVVAAQAITKKHNLSNAQFIANDALAENYSDGTIFYMFNPFPSLMTKFLPILQTVAKNHKIYIVAYANTAIELKMVNWLMIYKNLESPVLHQPLIIFESK